MSELDRGSDESRFELRDLVLEPDEGFLAEVYRRVLKPAFRADERESVEEIQRQAAGDSGLRLIAAIDGHGDPAGVITSNWYARSGVLLLGYLAVRADLRGRGIGTRLISQAVPRWVAELSPKLGVAEVEDPRHYASSDFGDPHARLSLYDRLGARIIAAPYFQPRLTLESQRTPHLLLMAFAINSVPIYESIETEVGTAALGEFLEDYFLEVEGPEGVNDEDFLALLGAVVRSPTVPLLRAGELDRLPAVEPT